MKVQKMVSLTPETAKKASEMDNFSLYIRDCLRGTQSLKVEQMKRRIEHLKSVIILGLERGSAHPDFIAEAQEIKMEMKI